MKQIYCSLIQDMLKIAEKLDAKGKHKQSDAVTNLAEMSLSDQKKYIGSHQCEALYAFMGWLTGRKERSGPFSGRDNAAEGAELVSKFCNSQGWEILPERDSGDSKDFQWIDDLKPYPEEEEVPYTESLLTHGKQVPVMASKKKLKRKEDEYVDKGEYKEKFEGVSLRKDKDGYYCHTHRARSDSYKSLAAIPKSVVKFIESTG